MYVYSLPTHDYRVTINGVLEFATVLSLGLYTAASQQCCQARMEKQVVLA